MFAYVYVCVRVCRYVCVHVCIRYFYVSGYIGLSVDMLSVIDTIVSE